MSVPRYLTKSRFKLGLECPTKLYYASRKHIYPDRKFEDPLLRHLANGGFQVGELAKRYFPDGVEVGRGDPAEAVARTRELIASGDKPIYEAAIQAEDYFIYADIVLKTGERLNLYEVKSKSVGSPEETFLHRNGHAPLAGWAPYLYDIAFQKMVTQLAYPELKVVAHLLLIDKSACCPSDGLNQKFRISRNENDIRVVVGDLTEDDLSVALLATIDVDDICDRVIAGELFDGPFGIGFVPTAERLADFYREDKRFAPQASTQCLECEFRADGEERAAGLKDGFRECWSEMFGWSGPDFDRQSVLDIWNYRGKAKLISERRVTLDAITEADIPLNDDGRPGLSTTARQWLQIQRARADDETPYIDIDGLSAEFEKWRFPLHFIDFETSGPAIPFNAGRRPYENVVFQFSHHVVNADGSVEHKGEWLNPTPGRFPNFDFITELRKELEADDGTIFQYSQFENSQLNLIYRQLLEEGSDASRGLAEFIRGITSASTPTINAGIEPWTGPRAMVDMLRLVKRFYYDPRTRGSNSIKQVLPAILNSSDYLRDKYSRPVYGAIDGIPSFNFENWAWVSFAGATVLDPYKLLPPIYEGISTKDLELLLDEESDVREGAAAMAAYAKLQFEDLLDVQREYIRKALLRYCELDTLAMVMIYEGWRELIYGKG
jgi:hypothetical protein